MQRTIGRSRVMLVLLMALGLMLGSVAAPAAATGGAEGESEGKTLESVRAETIGTIDYKTSLLTDLKNGTDKADRKAVYDDGIAQLAALRATAADEPEVERLRQMGAEAHGIYHDTKSRASAVGQTEEEKIAEVRNATLDTIDYKLGIFREAEKKTDNPAHKGIYAAAVGQLEALKAAAEAGSDVTQLKELKSQAHDVYDATKTKIGESQGVEKGDEGKQEEPEKTEAEKAAEALAKAKRSTLGLIEHKISIFIHGAEAAKNPAVTGAYEDAAERVAELTDDAQSATEIGDLKDIDAKVMEIYESTKAAVAESHPKPDWQPSESIKSYLDNIDGAVTHLVRVVNSEAARSPETADAVVKAGANVKATTDAVRAVCESGNKLDSKWADLGEAVHAFRKALQAHTVAVTGGPAYVNGWQLPG